MKTGFQRVDSAAGFLQEIRAAKDGPSLLLLERAGDRLGWRVSRGNALEAVSVTLHGQDTRRPHSPALLPRLEVRGEPTAPLYTGVRVELPRGAVWRLAPIAAGVRCVLQLDTPPAHAFVSPARLLRKRPAQAELSGSDYCLLLAAVPATALLGSVIAGAIWLVLKETRKPAL